MPKVIHFEFPAENPERAAAFYDHVFKWKAQKYGDMEYWLLTTGNEDEEGIDGAIAPKKDMITDSVINTVSVLSLDDSIKKVREAGGELMTEKMEIPGIGHHIYCRDTEGNVFGILESIKDPKGGL
ncbi:VOC family protein [Methanoplanus sp. FWC-SCC4]|uniref:VOC family protein n=1 Tax=Methanochimaera problematica TaxID=2609417 RepID=A0AA97FEH9_9EURY|nr:VOC family protein [Methanoplanus sp. FWC-SCC4]WOF17072.1 VOC family protein [Methanoplanus sp. FWC-SCC4]